MQKIVISGGGTGGHIFPAIAIANALCSLAPSTSILFVGAAGKMEMQKVPEAGFVVEGLPITGFQRSFTPKNVVSNLKFPFKLLYSLYKAVRIIQKFRPNCVVGVGGFASGPTLIAAQMLGVPTVIQEQNAVPGAVNKLLSGRIKLAFVAYNGLEKFFGSEKIRNYGNPVRQNIVESSITKTEASAFFGLDAALPTVLVTGGSQGALGINKGIAAQLELLKKAGVQLIWQTGTAFEPVAKKCAQELGYVAVTQPFMQKMDYAYAAADVVVSRAGAGAISELAVLRKPAILVPMPTAAADHQTKNAMELVQKNAAILVKNADAEHSLVPKTIELLNDMELQMRMKQNLETFDKRTAATQIAADILAMN